MPASAATRSTLPASVASCTTPASEGVDRSVSRLSGSTRGSSDMHEVPNTDEATSADRQKPQHRKPHEGGHDEEVHMGKFGLTKRCRCPRRAWTNGCPHSWHYKFEWQGRRFRATLDDVLRRHVSGKIEAWKEVEQIYAAVRDGTFGHDSAGALTLRQLGERYFNKYISPKTAQPLGRNERYRWNVIIETTVDGRPLGEYVASEIKKHQVEAFVETNRAERIDTILDAKGNTYQAKRGGAVSTNRSLGRLKAFFNWALDKGYLTENPAQRVHKLREFERERRLEPGEEQRLRALTKDDWL